MRTPAPAHPDLTHELALWGAGMLPAGIDEAGRGAWFGPVSAAAVILPQDASVLERLSGVRDSKQMSAKQRERWAKIVKTESIAWAVGMASAAEIDALGILPATRLAMMRALEGLGTAPNHLLIDAVKLPAIPIPQTNLIHGDAACLSIAAASVLAKTARDALMVEMDFVYPGYGLAAHKGYGTAAHRQGLDSLGVCAEHRRTYRPIAARLPKSE